ncbi:hypothetical protein [Xanthobacter autotrophicus]|uniref:hypothetical protein n=1 Tax=Xanthobacter autotrophicus TaxID=280 RepID=UPI0024A70A1E|nr:hypothetical protein [Xanthobacter autotrophicus]MDI4657128.1 hypothetical protein [Xanthobacter autotrophicus]
MSGLAHLLGYGVPWWIWGMAGLLAVAALARVAGPRAALAAAAVLAFVLAHRKGAQQGYSHAIQKGDRDAERILDTARAARAGADLRNGDARRLRDDDGFRRE